MATPPSPTLPPSPLTPIPIPMAKTPHGSGNGY